MLIHTDWNLVDKPVTITRMGLKLGRSVGKVRSGVYRVKSYRVTCLGDDCRGGESWLLPKGWGAKHGAMASRAVASPAMPIVPKPCKQGGPGSGSQVQPRALVIRQAHGDASQARK